MVSVKPTTPSTSSTEMMERMQQQEVQVKESRWAEEIPQRWRQPKGEDRTEIKKEERRLKCTLLNGSARSTERKYIRRYRATFDIFFGDRAQVEEGGNGGAVQQRGEGWRFAADAARITDERAGSEDQKAYIGRSFCCSRQESGSSYWRERRSSYVKGRLSRFQVYVHGGMRMFAAYSWHTEGWSPRNEAILEAVPKRARTTKHPWLIACDANMCPEDFEKSLWFRKDRMHVIAPDGVSTCRSRSAKGDWVEKVYDYVTACNSTKREIFANEGGGRFRIEATQGGFLCG